LAFTLTAADGCAIEVDGWNWHPTLNLIERAGLLPAETAAVAHHNARAWVSAAQARRISVFLDAYLQGLPGGARVLLDGAITTEPDRGELDRENLRSNYSATAEWLARFRDFCRVSDGFTIS
jgi:hypothetical protein